MSARLEYDTLRGLLSRRNRLEVELRDVNLEIETVIGVGLVLSMEGRDRADLGIARPRPDLIPERLQRRLGQRRD